MSVEKRSLEGFDALINSGSVDISFIPSDYFSVELSGRQEDLDRTFTEIRGTTLTVWQQSGGKSGNLFGLGIGASGSSMGPVAAVIHAPALRSWENTGTGNIRCAAPYVAKEGLDIRLSGTGSFCVDGLDCSKQLSVNSTGTGKVVLNGKAENVYVSLVGIGDVSGQLSYQSIQKKLIGIGRIEFL